MPSAEDILDVILEKDKYLRLAHYLLKNREDWNDGYSYAESGLNGFDVETETDKLIEDDNFDTRDYIKLRDELVLKLKS